jgi:outer membrane protein assembly factor BamD (BamD/ComL family)
MDRETRLLEESRRLTEARDALRRGDAAGALSTLSELQRAVPGGILGQEREALAIEALAKSGRSSEAQARARAFLQANPTSPHATRVEAFAR